jgi:hypothetical protein
MAQPHPLPLHLPIVEVSSLDDVERLATDGGPRRIVVIQAASLDEARAMLSALRAMLSALRAKGLLGNPHGGELDGSDFEGGASADEVEGGASADEVDGVDFGLLPVGSISDSKLLDRLLSDDDDILYNGPDGAGAFHGGGVDFVADGWEIDPLGRLHRADDMGRLLDEIVADTLPRLLNHPADPDTLRQLRIFGREIRRIGKEMPGLMGQAPVTLGNYVQNFVNKALKRGGSDRTAWVEERRGTILARILALCHDRPVSFLV